jgi:hypothetical protein
LDGGEATGDVLADCLEPVTQPNIASMLNDSLLSGREAESLSSQAIDSSAWSWQQFDWDDFSLEISDCPVVTMTTPLGDSGADADSSAVWLDTSVPFDWLSTVWLSSSVPSNWPPARASPAHNRPGISNNPQLPHLIRAPTRRMQTNIDHSIRAGISGANRTFGISRSGQVIGRFVAIAQSPRARGTFPCKPQPQRPRCARGIRREWQRVIVEGDHPRQLDQSKRTICGSISNAV